MVNVNGRQVMMTATMTMMTMRMMMMMMLFNFAEPLAMGLLLMTIMFLYNVEMLMFKDMFFRCLTSHCWPQTVITSRRPFMQGLQGFWLLNFCHRHNLLPTTVFLIQSLHIIMLADFMKRDFCHQLMSFELRGNEFTPVSFKSERMT